MGDGGWGILQMREEVGLNFDKKGGEGDGDGRKRTAFKVFDGV